MTVQKRVGIFTGVMLVLVLFMASTGMCRKSGYNYITVQEVKARLDAGDHENGTMVITTAQTEKEYSTGYIQAAVPTYARPLKTDEDFAKLIPLLNKVKDTDEDIVFICPRGRSGAERPYDYFKEHGVAESRMMVMEGGQEAFNKAYPDDVTHP